MNAEQHGEVVPVHVSYYTSQDGPYDATWSVYAELVPDGRDCIDGSQRLVCAGLSSESVADSFANELHRRYR